MSTSQPEYLWPIEGRVDPGVTQRRAKIYAAYPEPGIGRSLSVDKPRGAAIASSYDLPAAVAPRVQETGRTDRLWAGAIVTAAAAIFPRVQGIREEGESWWRLLWFFVPQDLEGVILVPLVILLTIGLFATVGRWAWRDAGARNRPAKVGLVRSLLGVAGVVVFWLSGPIVLGGLGTTLGLEGGGRERRGVGLWRLRPSLSASSRS